MSVSRSRSYLPLHASALRRLTALTLEESRIAERPGGEAADVKVRDHEPDQRSPGQLGVPGVHPGDQRPGSIPDRMRRKVLEPAAGYVPARVAGERIGPDQARVDEQDHAAEPHVPPLAVRVAEGVDCVPGQQQREQHRYVEEVPMNVLDDEREAGLAGIALVRLSDSTRRRRDPE